MNYESVFLENLKNKLMRFVEAEHLNEKDIIGKGIEEILKNRQKQEQKGRFVSTGPEQRSISWKGFSRRSPVGI